MKNEDIRKYIYISLAGFSAIALSIIFFFCFYRIDGFIKFIKGITGILTPFTYGLIIAYLLSPICYFFERKLRALFIKNEKDKDKYKKSISFASIAISLIIAILVTTLFFYLVLPEVWESIVNIINNVPDTIERLMSWIENFIENNPEISQQFQETYDSYFNELDTWLRTDFMVTAQKFVTGFSVKVFGVVNFFKNFLVGLIVSIYLLSSRKLFIAQSKKVTYSALSEKVANAVINQVRYANKVFGGFIRGKLLDSTIIGILCFIVCSALNMPYVMLVSVIIGITNIIPFFGPFIGAVPSIILIFTVSPMQSLYFLIFIIILQQFDGNILGPKILGQTVGISGFWVLFAILFFGGIWGPIGMIIGVPLFAVIYDVCSRIMKFKLSKKNLSTDTEDYVKLEKIENGEYKDF